MKQIQLITLLLALAGLFSSCGEKEKLPPAIFVTPANLTLEADANDLIEFFVTSTAGDNALERVVITNKPIGGITQTIKDTVIYGRESEFYFVYQVPSGATQYLLTFTVYDAEGLSARIGRNVEVESAAFLSETSGYEIYSQYGFGGNDAFHIANLQYLQLDADADSMMADIVEMDLVNDDAPSHNLTSLSGIRFVRNNAFNYPEATIQSAAATYTSSSSQQLITNIQPNDILITEYDTIAHKYAVIKITGVMNDTGVALDRYLFNVKK